ncbi:TIGR03620 family F420-dependent LLM class oxidoreductase [Georgenia sp. TF02-10]|uniref:TIGR03620 family F420-dependent LLM class oxidoreductase n=1 Tax=Georgenia sp. TF02-10 TaxID=2917725 RepID=UPI001FA6C1EF|nr:TIGR03620 family F420-dependent LLM class oxidoreductase [Georgenia sp. TF02-10]UNX56105.1 TIGR03620 family F420-dependent LLM class oxidoreductase [Georgenia sp. TF02-10]
MTSPQHPLGSYGVWVRRPDLTPDLATRIERLGYGTLWVGGSPGAGLEEAAAALAATERITVATGIVNIWRADAAETARSFRRLEQDHPGRFLLGLGSGHPEADKARRAPLAAMADYLDVLDAEGVPAHRRVLSALGPKMLRLAADRAAGSHPYLTVPAHTAWAREVLGPGAVLAPEVMVIGETDSTRARATGRQMLGGYLGMSNYTSTMLRWGFTPEDLADGGSDRLVDELTRWGAPAQLAAGLRAHLDAGASHVCAQVLPVGADQAPTLEALAAELFAR